MTFLNIIIGIGIPAIIGGLIYIGRKLQILDDMQKTIEKIKVNIKVICDHLSNTVGPAFDSGKLQNYSPIAITPAGMKFLQDIGFISMFAENQESFYQYIEKEKPKTDYDIEAAANRSISVLFDEEYFKSLKDYLYNNPQASRNEFFQVAGIYVRDQYNEWLSKRNSAVT